MVDRGQGMPVHRLDRGPDPGTFQAVYNGAKAFIDSFAWALRNELKDPGSAAPTSGRAAIAAASIIIFIPASSGRQINLT